MSNRIEGPEEKLKKFMVGNAKIVRVEEYTYLGQTVAFEYRTEKELKIRRIKAWGKFWSLNKISKNKKLGLKSKVKILDSCILPVLSYGSQTWSLTKVQTQKLQKTQRAMERKIMGIRLRDKISNRELREKTGSKDMEG